MTVGGGDDAVGDVRHVEVLDEFDASLIADVVLLALPVGDPFGKSRALTQVVDLDLVGVGHLHVCVEVMVGAMGAIVRTFFTAVSAFFPPFLIVLLAD